jgi:hypothetical protein
LLKLVVDRADGHGASAAVDGGFGLVGKTAGGDALPGAVVTVALPAAAGAPGPLPAASARLVG